MRAGGGGELVQMELAPFKESGFARPGVLAVALGQMELAPLRATGLSLCRFTRRPHLDHEIVSGEGL